MTMVKETPFPFDENDDLELNLPPLDGNVEDEDGIAIVNLDEIGLGDLGENENIDLDCSTGCDQLPDDDGIFNLSDADEDEDWLSGNEADEKWFDFEEDLIPDQEGGWLETPDSTVCEDRFLDDLFQIPELTELTEEDNGEEGVEEHFILDGPDDEILLPPLEELDDEDSNFLDDEDIIYQDFLDDLANQETIHDKGEEG